MFSPPAIALLTRLCPERWRTDRASILETQLALCIVVSCLTWCPSLIERATPYTHGRGLMVMLLILGLRLGSSACLKSTRRTFFWASVDEIVGKALLGADLGRPVALVGGGGL